MKKVLVFLIGFLTLISCSHDTEFRSAQEVKEIQYEQAFEQAFGKINPSQTWGFAQSSKTRASYPNGNNWVNEGYGWPADITADELKAVKKVFAEKGKASYEALVDWDCFFVQQVYKGDSIYKDGFGQKVTGANHMDWLCAYDPTGHKEIVYGLPEYNYQPHEIISHDDHVYNFNNSYSNDYGGRMLMINSSTQRFGFKSSTDNGHVFYNFRMEVINGNYYVGFDFEAAGANGNEQVARDYVYDDWIVKIVPGTGVTPPDRVKEEGMIICEDLGNIGDFDFNDIVFYAKVWESGKTEITLLAAGGRLEATVAGVNVGEKMGKMVNTGLRSVPSYYFVSENKYNSLIDIPIIICGTDAAGNVTAYELTAIMGKAPQKICVPLGFKWCKEYESLSKVYPGFKDWTTGSASTWTGNYDEDLVMN
jgi:hypothetical protein